MSLQLKTGDLTTSLSVPYLTSATGLSNVNPTGTGSFLFGGSISTNSVSMKGYYYKYFNLSGLTGDGTSFILYLSSTQCTYAQGVANQQQAESSMYDSSFTCGYAVGDWIGIVDNGKWAHCAKIAAIDHNKLTFSDVSAKLKSALTQPASTNGWLDNADGANQHTHEYSIHCVAKYNIGNNTIINEGIVLGGHKKCKSLGLYSFVSGASNIASGNYSVAFGKSNDVEGYSAFSAGWENTVYGHYSTTFGWYNVANGVTSFVAGALNTVDGDYAFVAGYQNQVSGLYSFCVGRDNIVTGEGAFASGIGNTVSGTFAEVEGSGNTVSGAYSHAEGIRCESLGEASHAEGVESKSIGRYSHAEGNSGLANGDYSHVEGSGATTSSTAYASHAEGRDTLAANSFAHAEGDGTISAGDSQHVEGRYNIIDSDGIYQTIIGNGSSNSRSNMHTLDWSGNAWFAGTVTAEGNKQLATREYVDQYGSSRKELVVINSGGTVTHDNHYTLNMTQNTTIHATGGTVGFTATSEIFIRPGSYTLTAGNNLVMVNALEADKTNYCTLVWYGATCRLYVIDAW